MTGENVLCPLPCPFCGGAAEVEDARGSGGWSVGCADQSGDCYGYQSLTTFPRKSEAIAAWNRRPSPVVGEGAVAWRYELAGSIRQDKTYTRWSAPKLAFEPPCVPEGSVRNLTPLYAAPSTIQTGDGGVREAVSRLEEIAGWFADDSVDHMLAASVAKEHSKDLRTILAALASPPGTDSGSSSPKSEDTHRVAETAVLDRQAIVRLAYGYELMHHAICQMAGTSGASGRWYYDKANEVFARVAPVFAVRADSNPGKPGDCLSAYHDFLKEHDQGSGLRALGCDPEAQAHSEIEPDGRPSARADQEGRSGREAGRRDEVRTSGAERGERDLRPQQPEDLTGGGGGPEARPPASEAEGPTECPVCDRMLGVNPCFCGHSPVSTAEQVGTPQGVNPTPSQQQEQGQ